MFVNAKKASFLVKYFVRKLIATKLCSDFPIFLLPCKQLSQSLTPFNSEWASVKEKKKRVLTFVGTKLQRQRHCRKHVHCSRARSTVELQKIKQKKN